MRGIFHRLKPAVPWAVATAVTVLALVAVVQIDAMEQQRSEEEARAAILTQLGTIRAKLEHSLTGPLLRTQGLVAHIISTGDIKQHEFDTLSRVLLEGHSNVINMVVSRGMVIAMSYPLAGNESVIGVSYPSIPAQYAMVLKAVESRAPVLQGPVPLIQGGTGLIFRNPVFLDDPDGTPGPFFGMVNIILDIPRVFADAGLDDPELPFQVALRGRDGLGAAGELISGDAAVFAANPAEVDVNFLHGSWRMAAIPHGGWAAVRGSLTPMRAMGSVLFLLMAFTAFATARHVTRRAETEQALRAKTAELERTNADLQGFAYAASHDLQTPLRTVVSYAQILSRRYRGRLDADADEYLGFLVDGARRMSTLVHDLQTYVRASGAGEALKPVDAGRALERALDALDADIRSTGAEIVAGVLPQVMADEQHLATVFQNLLHNALRYRSPDRPPVVHVEAHREKDERWTIAVADNGVGIAPEHFERIFQVFQRLHTPGGTAGSGIGLALCKRILQGFGGSIRVESRPGAGSTFLLTLQAAPQG